ncbi:MAG: hypothetical protein IT487_08745 [Chromatiaceae bacterium]|nr:hypothetical protein [Chromatiaceae bacterium]
MFNQKKLAVAVTVALGASVGFMSSAQATSSLFFPHVVGSQTVASVVTVINTAGGRIAQYTNGNLHQTLWTKNIEGTEDAANARVCKDYNQYVTTSFNDITTFDVYGEFGQDTNGIMFENRVTTNRVDNSDDPNWSVGLGADVELPQRGFLLVSNEDFSSITDEGVLRGEAFIFEFAAGATWGYQAANRNPDVASGDSIPFYDYVGAASADNSALAIMPYDEFATALMVTPLPNRALPVGDAARTQNVGNLSTNIRLSQRAGGIGGFFDRDENPFSRTNGKSVVCVGRIDMQNLLFGANGPAGQFLDGGWSTLEINAGGATVTGTGSTANSSTGNSNAVVFKLEYNISDTINGEPVVGTFNNAIHILPPGLGWVTP